MVSSAIQPLSSSGSDGTSSRYQRITSGDVGQVVEDRAADDRCRASPMSWQRKVNEVTIPKFPPPPRSAQNRSPWELSLAVTKVPSARTTSAASRLSTVRPKRRVR